MRLSEIIDSRIVLLSLKEYALRNRQKLLGTRAPASKVVSGQKAGMTSTHQSRS